MSEEIMDVVEEKKDLVVATEAPLGFEDEQEGDMIVPRIKVINALSPECKDRLADEGDIVNSLTKSKLNERTFIPVFKYNSNINWKPRNEGGGILCTARDGKNATQNDGVTLLCNICRKHEFDNTKTGRESYPTCTKYINFFGFVVGEPIPIILSFAKTNYPEGKKMYSLAKVTMQNMWNYGYTLSSKKLAKNGNEWYNIIVSAAGASTEEDREFGASLYKQFRHSAILSDVESEGAEETSSFASDKEVASTEF